jgi:hypothetical protein
MEELRMTLMSALGASFPTAHRASTFRNVIGNYEATEDYYSNLLHWNFS